MSEHKQNENSGVKLSDAIAHLRSELTMAQQQGAKSDLKFTINELEVELHVVLESSAERGGGFNWNIFSFNAGATNAQASTHRILLKMGLAPNKSNGDMLIDDTTLG